MSGSLRDEESSCNGAGSIMWKKSFHWYLIDSLIESCCCMGKASNSKWVFKSISFQRMDRCPLKDRVFISDKYISWSEKQNVAQLNFELYCVFANTHRFVTVPLGSLRTASYLPDRWKGWLRISAKDSLWFRKAYYVSRLQPHSSNDFCQHLTCVILIVWGRSLQKWLWRK